MKKLFLLTFIVTASFLTSCDELKDAADIDFNTTVSADITVSITEPGTTYDNTTILDLSNEDTEDHLDKIKNVSITKLTYTVINFAGDAAGTITGDLKADGVTLHSVANQNVSDAFFSATVFEVTDPNLIKNAAQKLLNNHHLTLQTTGTADYTTSLFFIVRVTAELKVKANALD